MTFFLVMYHVNSQFPVQYEQNHNFTEPKDWASSFDLV